MESQTPSQRLAAHSLHFSVLVGLLLVAVAGYGQKAHPSRLRIDDYGLHFRGDTLRPGQDTTRWIEVLGPPSRVENKEELVMSTLIWDDLGIAVESGSYLHDKRLIYLVILFFCNLENCEEGLRGNMFDHFSSNYSGLFTKKKEREWRKDGTDERLISYAKKKNAPSNYIYPFSTLRKIVLNGIPLDRDSKIETINPKRAEADLPKFKFGPWPYLGTHGIVVPEFEKTTKTYPGNYRSAVTTKPTPSTWDLVLHYGGYRHLLYLMMVIPY